MLAAHRDDQENLLGHLAGPSKQQLQAKTPGARYPKTPLKIPLNDENANNGFGGKSVLRTKGNNENIATAGKTGKLSVVTPAAPRTTRAPLGNKTTNAKARTGPQTGGVKDTVRQFEKSAAKPTTVRPKQSAPQVEPTKLEIHTDKSPLEEEEIEYAPPRPKDLPYESDIIPEGTLTFEGLKPENMFKGYYQHYFNHVDENGTTETERQMEQQRQREFKRGDEQIRKDMEEFDWSVGDVPASKNAFKKDGGGVIEVHVDRKPVARPLSKVPATIASRKAASALAMPARQSASSQTHIRSKALPSRKPLSLLAGRRPATKSAIAPARDSSRERAAAVAASRSTLGYSKGRSALSAVRKRDEPAVNTTITPNTNTNPAVVSTSRPDVPRTLSRSISTVSSASDCTITPARFAKTQDSKDWKKLEFLSIFDADDDEDGGFGGTTSSVLADDLDEDFQLSTEF
ncbi:hypothetical protein V8F33_001784 [Rhypophila sp. PSN 637]